MATCLALVSCSQEDGNGTDVDGDSGVHVLFRVADSPVTRETEAGWDEGWNENSVTKIVIFRFAANGEIKDHLSPSNLPSFTAQNTVYQELVVNGLTYSDLADSQSDMFYMVANCEDFDPADIQSIDDLKACMSTPELVSDSKQTLFAMDSNGVLTVDASEKTVTLRFDLQRAAVKIRMAVNDEAGKSIIDDCTYKLNNYVLSSTSVLADGEKYGQGTGQELLDMPDYSTSQLGKDNLAVFYSYPNDWFDESKARKNDDGTWTIDDYGSMDPINAARQTHIMLCAPYGGKMYYYKVPVNHSIYENNDAASFTEAQYNEIRDLHRTNRNHIYDITVKIDRAGGSMEEPVTPEFYVRINDWEPGGDYNIGEGEFQYR